MFPTKEEWPQLRLEFWKIILRWILGPALLFACTALIFFRATVAKLASTTYEISFLYLGIGFISFCFLSFATVAKLYHLIFRKVVHKQISGFNVDPMVLEAINSRIHGVWKWQGAYLISISKDGHIACSTNGKAEWTWLDIDKQILQIKWEKGWIDTLTISEDGKKMTGQNNFYAFVEGVKQGN